MLEIAQSVDTGTDACSAIPSIVCWSKCATRWHRPSVSRLCAMSLSFFPRIEPLFCLVDENRSPSQARHSGFESKPGSQRRLLEKHCHLLAGKGAAKGLRPPFIIPAKCSTAATPSRPKSRVETRSSPQKVFGTRAGTTGVRFNA